MGVAIIGSVFASLFGPAIRRAFEPFRGRRSERSSAERRAEFDGGGQDDRGASPGRRRSHCWRPKLTAAFMDGFHRGCLVAAATAVVVAVVVFCYLPARNPSSDAELVFEH